jgi:hypothetical protein
MSGERQRCRDAFWAVGEKCETNPFRLEVELALKVSDGMSGTGWRIAGGRRGAGISKTDFSKVM